MAKTFISSQMLMLAVCALGPWGCAGGAGSAPASNTPEGNEGEPPVLPLPALTVDEERVMDMLKRHVAYFEKLGERNETASWELADAADYIALELENMGYPLERQGYETKNVAAQNLAVTISGSERGDQVVVVGAHYDSPAGDRGQNAGGSGAAALLTLAEMMRGAELKRALRLVFFSMGESPHGDGEGRGARHYARYLTKTVGEETSAESDVVRKRAETVGFVHLDRLGSLAPEEGARAPLSARLISSSETEVLRQLFLEDVDPEIFSISESALPADSESDLGAFVEQGIFGISLQGTGADSEPVQYEHLARLVMQIRRGIGRVSGERPTNDGMLTPLREQVR